MTRKYQKKWLDRATYGKLMYKNILRLEKRFLKEDDKTDFSIDKLNSLAAKIGYLVQIALQNLSAIEEKQEIEELRRIEGNVQNSISSKESVSKEELNPTHLRG